MASLWLLVLLRLVLRSCSLLDDGLLRVRGFWGTYVIPASAVGGIATTGYEAYYQGYKWSKVIVTFGASGRRHSVVVSANRRMRTTTRKASQIATWLELREPGMPILEGDNWRPSRGEFGCFLGRLRSRGRRHSHPRAVSLCQ